MTSKIIAFSWFGGKFSHLGWLLPIIDSVPHTCYVEPFGGSAAVLLNKKPSQVEVYNDIYSDVVNFFRVLRAKRDELISQLHLTPYSREEFADACNAEPSQDEVERARQFFIKARQVRSGLATTASEGRWGYVNKDSRRNMAQTVSRWLGAVDGLEDVCSRLKDVQIENLDALDVIRRYDTEVALHYIDPPYLMETRSGGKAYAHEYSEEKHVELLQLLLSLKGKVILSTYDNDLYRTTLNGWHEHKAEATYSASTRRKGNAELRQEVIWTNFQHAE